MLPVEMPPPAPAAAESAHQDHSSDLRGIIYTVLDKAWILVLCVTIAALYASYHVKHAPRIYEATATIQVQTEENKLVKVERVMQEDLRNYEVLNTIVQKFYSRSLMELVVDDLKLTQHPAFVTPGSKEPAKRENVVGAISGMVRATLRRGTRLIDISVLGIYPELNASIANSLVEQYMAQDFQFSSSTTKGAYTYLRDESERLKKKLEASEQTLQKYREEAGTVSFQQGQDVVGLQLKDTSAKYLYARADAANRETTYKQFKNIGRSVSELLLVPQIIAMPSVMESRAQAARQEQEFKVLCFRYREKHSKYVVAAFQLEEARKAFTNAVLDAAEMLNNNLRMDFENAKKQELIFEKELREAEAAALAFSRQAIHFSLLSRDVDSDRALFETVINRLKETSLTTDLKPEKIRSIQAALRPQVPVSPNVQRIYMTAILAGFMAGLMFILGLNAMDSSFKSVEQAESALNLRVLTVIPKLKELRGITNRVVAAEGSVSTGAESFRTLRTSLSMLGHPEDRRSFLFTSAFPQEGKTFTSMNFSVSLAQQGLRTILIDADLRRPSVEEFITGKHGQCPGVTDYLHGTKKLSELVQKSNTIENLFWVPAGKVAPNPSELLAQGGFFKVLDEALQNYDCVVVDSAPIQAVSDTLLIVKRIQTTVLVLRGQKSPRKPVQRSVQLLANAGARLGGVVLNFVTLRGRGYYYNGYYEGYYASYGYGYGKDRKSSGSKSGVEKTDDSKKAGK